MRSNSLAAITSVFAICCFLASCSTSEAPGSAGVSLTTQQMIADVGGAKVGEVVKGSAVACIGFSPDSSTVKISFGSEEGWVPISTIAFNAQPGIGLRYSTLFQGGSPGENAIIEGTILGIDSVNEVSAHVYFVRVGVRYDGWVKTADVSTNPKDIAMILGVEAISKLPVAEHDPAYRKLLEENAGGYFARTFKVNLSEAPDTTLANIQERFNMVVSKSSNTVTMPISSAQNLLAEFLHELAGDGTEEQDEPVEEETDPRRNYFYHYICQLPSFVKIGPRYEFASYEYINATRAAIAYFLFRLDRSPENIQALWDSYRDLVIPRVNPVMGQYVEDLIVTHDHIIALPNYQALCAEVSKKVAAWEKNQKTFFSAVMEQRDFYDPILHHPTIMKYSEMEGTAGYWLHSFWVRRLAEGNADIVYKILKEISQNPDFKSGGVIASPIEIAPETLSCKFQDVGLGDCWHVIFDCGDYGDADDSQLDPAGKALWAALSKEGENGESVANPEYIGKQFFLRVSQTRGRACNEGQGGEGDIPLLLEFRLAGN